MKSPFLTGDGVWGGRGGYCKLGLHVCDTHIFLFGGRIFLAFFKWQLATNIHGLPPMKHFKPELIEAASKNQI